MILLLDTSVLIWLLGNEGGKRLGPNTKRIIEEAEDVYASSINVIEIRIKYMLGKLVAPDDLLGTVAAAGLKFLSLTPEHADAILRFPALARHDPFDRMLLAQAKVESLSLLTSDQFLLQQGFDFLLDARD